MATLTELNTPKTSKLSHSSKKIQSNSVLKVRVVVRIRPFLPCEINLQEGKDRNPIPCITVLNPQGGRDEEVTVHIKDQETSRNECYKLDSFFGQEDNNVGQIFRSEVSPLIPGIFHGCNATVFAYGATGSGKTYTMQGTDEQPGLMPLAMLTILSMCENTRSSIEISYYEVYMDRCYDLLEPKVKEISVFDDKDGRVQLKGLSQVPIQSMTEFHEVFLSGNQRRKVAHTGLNDVSSRSHGVLMIVVSTRGDGSDCSVTGKLNLIDLAGNEDNRRSGNEGIRLQESAKINQSLFALSNVIYALNNDEPRVPYRESKLTRILQDSLGGTSRALMIACLNPVSYQEAVHTVSLAARSRQIVNYVPSVHKQETTREKVDMEAKLRAWLESKGKMKSIHRTVPPNSPFLGKTPTPVTSQKKSVSVCSSLKSQNIDQGVSNAKGRRKLFDSGTSITVTMEESCSSNALTTANDFVSTKDESLLEVENSKNYANEIHDNLSFLPEDESCTDNKLKPSNAMCIHTADQDKEKMDLAYDVNMSGPSASIADESFDKEKITTPFTNFVGSPTIEEKIRELQNSLRKFFSPINSNLNMTPSEDLSSKERVCLVLFEPKKSKTPHVFTYDNDDLERTGTPLDKFNARSSTLKNSLVQEYLAFLNNASKEELLGLKGIGQKRADYILQLREETPEPLKSLSDLEKIGISSKQVHDMFRTMARGIFS